MEDHNHKSLTVPPFPPKLPLELIEGLDKREKYLYLSVDKITQVQDWLTQRAVLDAKTMEEVKEQVLKTNGRLLVAESDIQSIKKRQDEAENMLKTIKMVGRTVQSKWFFLAALAFFTIGIPWLSDHAGIVFRFFKLMFGL